MKKMKIAKGNRIISLILKVVVILSAGFGTWLSAYAGRETFMGGSSVFMFFTIQSNLAIALISLIGLILLIRGKDIPNFWFVIKFVGTVSITLTGAVFCFVLAPTLGDQAWNLQNILTHVVVPILSIIDFFVTGVYSKIKKRCVFFVTLPPLAYVIYAGIGYVSGWEFLPGINYPYFFLNWGSPAGAFGFASELPFMGSFWWILGLLFLLIGLGFLYLWIITLFQKRMEK